MPEARGGAQEGSPPTSRVGCWRAEGVTPQYWTVVGELEGCWKAASVDAARSNKGWWWWWCIGRMVVHRARVSAGSPRPGAGRLAADESCGLLEGRGCPSVLEGPGVRCRRLDDRRGGSRLRPHHPRLRICSVGDCFASPPMAVRRTTRGMDGHGRCVCWSAPVAMA